MVHFLFYDFASFKHRDLAFGLFILGASSCLASLDFGTAVLNHLTTWHCRLTHANITRPSFLLPFLILGLGDLHSNTLSLILYLEGDPPNSRQYSMRFGHPEVHFVGISRRNLTLCPVLIFGNRSSVPCHLFPFLEVFLVWRRRMYTLGLDARAYFAGAALLIS